MRENEAFHFDDMRAFAEFAGLSVDRLGQIYDGNGDFLGLICETCGSLKATEDEIWKMGWWFKAEHHDFADKCPVCHCSI